MASESDDAAEAAARLEAALERIAALAGAHPQPAGAPPDPGEAAEPTVPVEEIAARLDSLIDRLRAALGLGQD